MSQSDESRQVLSAVVIAGMHRSGTSLVARVVNLLGIDLGDPGHLMDAKPDNPTGFWENKAIAGFNDDLLAQLGGQWDRPAAPRPGWEMDASLDPWLQRARALVSSEFGDRRRVAWKDPRMSLLLPFWRRVVDVDATLVAVRDPGEVAGSLSMRSGMSVDAAADLWLRYTITALADAPGAVVIRYEGFFDDLDGTVDRLARDLGLPAPTSEVRAQIAEFFDAGLRHHGAYDESAPSLETARAMYTLLADRRPSHLFGLLTDAWRLNDVELELSRVEVELSRTRDDLADMIDQRDIAITQRDQAQSDTEEARRETAIAEERTRIAGESLGRLERLGLRLRADLEASRREVHSLKRAATQGEERR